MSSANRLTDDRLASIEQGARESHTLMDRVIIELVPEEIRRLRGLVTERASHTVFAQTWITLRSEHDRPTRGPSTSPEADSCCDGVPSVTDLPDGDELPVLELGGGWRAELLTADQWRRGGRQRATAPIRKTDPRTPLVYVISKVTPNTQPGEAGR